MNTKNTILSILLFLPSLILFSQTETDLLLAYRQNQDIAPLIRRAIYDKKKERGGAVEFNDNFVKKMKNRSMVSIGG